MMLSIKSLKEESFKWRKYDKRILFNWHIELEDEIPFSDILTLSNLSIASYNLDFFDMKIAAEHYKIVFDIYSKYFINK